MQAGSGSPVHPLATLLLAFALAACGGGGGGNQVAALPPPPAAHDPIAPDGLLARPPAGVT